MKEQLKNTYFTSDLHFQHSKILNFNMPYRSKFKTVEEMDNEMITLWNNTIKPEDTIYNLGDVCFSRSKERIASILEQLNGHHHLILGNHDQTIANNMDYFLNRTKAINGKNYPLLSSISRYREIKIENNIFILFHYPIQEWNKGHYGSIHLYGHLHNNLAPLKGKAINVGLDFLNKIVSANEIIEILKEVPNFSHHKKEKNILLEEIDEQLKFELIKKNILKNNSI